MTFTEDGALALFSEVSEGDELHVMQGDMNSLTQRAAKVLANAMQLLPADKQPAGALMIYCAGCMLTVGDDIQAMSQELQSLTRIPIIGLYTFGEQGCFLDGENRHGNLMISAVVFSQ